MRRTSQWAVSFLCTSTLGLLAIGSMAAGQPIAAFSGEVLSGEAPFTVAFDARASASPGTTLTRHLWVFGDGSTGSGKQVTHVYTVRGRYEVTLVVMNGQGASAMQTGIVDLEYTDSVLLAGIDVGNAAPEFTLQDLHGDPVSLSDQLGRVVILLFWASWCGPCKELLPELVEAVQGHEDDEVIILGVTIDTKSTDALAYLSANRMSEVIGLWGSLEDARAVQETFQAVAMPYVYVLDRAGIIRFAGKPPNPVGAMIEPWL